MHTLDIVILVAYLVGTVLFGAWFSRSQKDVKDYFKREVLPHAPDAWIDEEKTRIGYEIPFNRHFYVFEPPRPLAQIDAELAEVTTRIQRMLTELSA